MAQRIPRPSSAPPSNNQVPGPPSDPGGQVDHARNAVLFILKDTDWPKRASNEVQNLIRNMEAPLALNKIPKQGTETPEELANAIHQLVKHLESAQTRLKGESEKYGTKKKGFSKRVKVFFSRKNPSHCADVVRSCRDDIVESSTTLSDILDRSEARNEQPLSRAAGDGSKGPLGISATPTASTSNPHANGRGDLTATSGPSSSTPNQYTSQDDQVTSNGCRNDAEKTSATLNAVLSNKNTPNQQPFTQVVEDQASSGSRLPATQLPPVTTVLAPNATLRPATNPAQSSNPGLASAPQPGVSEVSGVGLGKEKGSSRRGELLNGANKVFKFAEGVSGALPVVGSYVGEVAKVGLTVVEMVQAMDDNDETAEGLGAHVCRLSNILERFSNQPRQAETSRTTNGMEELQQALRDVRHQIAEGQSQPSMKKFWNASDQSGRLKNLQERVHAALEEIQLLVNLKTSIFVEELHNEILQSKHRQLLNCLGDGKYGARGDAIEDVTCLSGTRVEILGRIDSWIRGGSNSERVLWIRGMAGRGKSTIATTIAHNWKSRACCATYHFRRGQNSSNASLVCALARQLGRGLDPELRNAILSTVEKNEDIINQRLDEQFSAFFTASLQTLRGKSFPILIVVDALDECDSVDYAVNFVKLIDRHSTSLPDNVKFLLTSRPEAPLIRALEPRKWHVESLDSMDDVDADIERFLGHALLQVKMEHEIEGEWPASADIPRLAQMSQGVFQWARTVVKYVNDGSPTDQLAELLGSPTVWSGVDELYTQILSKALERARQQLAKENLFLSLLGTLVAAPYPVSLEVIAFLHAEHDLIKGKTPEVVFNFLRRGILADLNSLLFVPGSSSEPIRLMHTSIRDLLIDRQRCRGQAYSVDLAQNHQRLASACIRQMNRHLRENICNLKDLSRPVSEIQDIAEREVSKGVQYCCRSWSIHLAKGQHAPGPGEDKKMPLGADLKLFSEEKILFWLEVMSSIECFNEAVMMAKQVHQWLLEHLDEASELNSFVTLWNDVHRFTTAFSEPIALNPIHIYVSALAHCPVNTELWRRYSGHAKVRTIRGVQPLTWSSDLWTRAVGSEVNSIAFSPDGMVLALGCSKRTIHLVDTHSGREMREPLEGHSRSVWCVCFSPDGKLLASGSHDRTIRLWDLETGTQMGEPLTGHSRSVSSICFSPDGKLLVSGSGDSTIRLWDPQTGSQVSEPLTGHSDAVWSVCSSPDGKLLASGSDDNTIRLWDPQTGRQVGEPLTGHSKYVLYVCFSPDGKLLASGSIDKTIRLWDPQTGRQVGEPLTGQSDNVFSLCFSSDGKLLASGSGGKTIKLWTPQTSSQVGEPLTGHDIGVCSLCFSPDGKLLVSGSQDGTIRLWDPHAGSQVGEPLTGHSKAVFSGCFSPDGKLLAFGYDDKTIRLWDPQTGSQVGEPLTGHDGDACSLCFSPNGRLLASGSTDDTIRLWDPQTGRQVGEPLKGHSYTVFSVCFSPNGKLLASGSNDGTIRLWDPETGSQMGEPLTGHSDAVLSVCFSPDGKLLASGSNDKTIRLWNPQTGSQVGQPLTAHSISTVWSVCFSLDGKLLASGSDDMTIRLWDPQTGRQVGEPLTGHDGHVWSVCFLPGSKLLASRSDDKTIRFWDPETGSQVGEPFTGHAQDVLSVCFSPDGQLLAIGSDDNAIRLYDLQTRSQVGEPLTAHGDRVQSVCFSPDGKLLASRSYDKTILLWDPQTGSQVGEPLTGHSYEATSVWFSPDGKAIAGRDSFDRSMTCDTSTCRNCDISSSVPRHGVTALQYKDHWVTLSSSRLFWLPSNYWSTYPPILTLYEGKLAVAYDNTVSIFDISDALSVYDCLHL